MNDEEQAQPPQETAAGHSGADSGVAPEISRRVGSILDAVEREASRLREEARAEAIHYLDHAKNLADSLVYERQRRIAEISDQLIAKSEAVVARLDDAAPVRQGFENLVRALGDAAERLSNETESSGGEFEAPPFHGVPPQPGSFQPPPGTPPPIDGGGFATRFEHPGRAPRPQSAYQPPPTAPPAVPYYPPPAADPAPWQADPGFAAIPSQPHPERTPFSPGWETPEAPGSGGLTSPATQGDTDPRELDDARMVAIQMAASGATRGEVREHLHRALGIARTTGALDEVFGPGSGEDARVPWASG